MRTDGKSRTSLTDQSCVLRKCGILIGAVTEEIKAAASFFGCRPVICVCRFHVEIGKYSVRWTDKEAVGHRTGPSGVIKPGQIYIKVVYVEEM
jgi:hypothetical protein